MTVPSLSLAGKVAIVTGSRRGLGKAIAVAFAEAGADVVVADLNIEDGALEAVAEEIQQLGQRSLAIQVDTSQKDDVENLVNRVIDEFGTIDILLNNAAIITHCQLLDLTEEDWDSIMSTDLKGYYLCCQTVGKIMVKRKSGNIVNIASIRGIRPRVGLPYSVAKAGVIMLTKLLAMELGGYNIRVNAIAPYLVKTEMTRYLWDEHKTLKYFEDLVPLGHRVAEPSDISAAALYLASEASSFITAQTIIVDGGALTGELRL